MARILVCEDEPDILELIQVRLTRVGHEVLTASDGRMGLRRALEDQPELLLVDWMMPGMTGVELVAAVRAHPTAYELPILMLTARAQQGDIDAAFAAGVDGFIIKPFRAGELQERIAALLVRA